MTTLHALADAEPRAAEHLTQAVMGARRAQVLLIVCPQESRAEAVARAFVRALLCQARSGRDGCGACANCRRLAQDNHADVLVPEVGARGLSVDGVRALCRQLTLTGRDGALKVAHVRGMARMAAPAQNALLKSLEEPPGDVCFVLTGSRAQGVLPTVRSRAQLLRLHGTREADAVATLVEAGVPEVAARLVAVAVGDDAPAARALVEAGLPAFLQRLEGLLVAGGEPQAIAKLATDFGADERAKDAAMVALEALVCDALALASGGLPSGRRLPQLAKLLLQRGRTQLVAAADALLAWRALGAVPVNRGLALETLFHLLLAPAP